METVDRTSKRVGILFVHANNVDVGGADYCLLKNVRELSGSRFRPVVVLRVRTRIVDLYEQLGAKVLFLPQVRWRRQDNLVRIAQNLLLFPVSIAYLVSTIIKEQARIVHSNDLFDFAGSIAAKITGRYAIQHIRMIVLKNSFARRFISFVLSISNDKILCVSGAVKEWYFGLCPNKVRKSEVLFDWVDMDAVGQAGVGNNLCEHLLLPEGTPLVGMVGRMEWWKGHHVFVRAARRVHQAVPESHFLIVGGKVFGRGREHYEDELRQLADTLGISEYVHFLGEREDVLNVLRQFTVAVHCSVEPDPFPGVVLEAMYSGRPVVAARSGGVVEQIEDGVSGLLYEPGNDRDLADKVVSLLKNPQLRTEMGSNGQRRVQTTFNKEKILAQLMSIYESGVAA
jgi:glycosyltransferase involved in cell wall biosynthesis